MIGSLKSRDDVIALPGGVLGRPPLARLWVRRVPRYVVCGHVVMCNFYIGMVATVARNAPFFHFSFRAFFELLFFARK